MHAVVFKLFDVVNAVFVVVVDLMLLVACEPDVVPKSIKFVKHARQQLSKFSEI